MRLGRAARAAGDIEKAATAFARVYYEFPLSDLSALAGSELESMPNVQPIAPGSGHASEFSTKTQAAVERARMRLTPEANPVLADPRSTSASGTRRASTSTVPSFEALS